MALITCPECGNSISEYASMCLHCGCPMNMIVLLLEKEKQKQQEAHSLYESYKKRQIKKEVERKREQKKWELEDVFDDIAQDIVKEFINGDMDNYCLTYIDGALASTTYEEICDYYLFCNPSASENTDNFDERFSKFIIDRSRKALKDAKVPEERVDEIIAQRIKNEQF